MRLSHAAVLALAALTTACGAAVGDDVMPSARPDAVSEAAAVRPAPSAPASPAPPPDPLALPAEGEPTAPDDPAALAELLTAAERALRDPQRAPESLRGAGHWQQVAYRKLGSRPELVEPVMNALPPELRAPARANLFAGARLADMHKPKNPPPPGEPRPEPKLPSWRIVPPPPADELLGYYREAEAATGVHWTYLAAVNLVETRMGRIRGTSVAGAQGPMQFMPATWAEWGRGDVNNPRDAVLAAGRYLRWGGMPGDVNGALFRYNRDVRYVDAVRTYAEQMQADPRAYYGYHQWQVYFGSVWLPEGYDGSTG